MVKKIVYIVVPYANFESIFGVGFWNNDVCYNVGYAESESGIVINGTTYHKKKKISDKILEIFTQIKKPFTINKYYQYANGEIRNSKYDLEENTAGYPFVKALRFYQSEAYIEAQKRRLKCYKQRNKAMLECNGEGNSIWSSCKSNAYDTFADCTNKIATYVKTSLQVEETEGSLAEMSYWKVIKTDKIAKFREVYMDWDGASDNHQNATYINQRNNLTGQLFDDIVKNWTFLAKVKIAMNWDSALEDKHFYNFETDKVINDAVGTIPGADIFTDPVGAIYAGIRGDNENALIYSVSFAIPFAGASYVKGGKKVITKSDEVFGLVAKKANNADGFELVYRQIDNIDPKEFQLTSIVQNLDKKIKNKVHPNDFKRFTDDDFIRSQLNRLSGVVDDLPNIVKGLGNLTEKESKKLLKDLNKSKRFKKLFILGDRASKLKYIDSWRILKENKISICK